MNANGASTDRGDHRPALRVVRGDLTAEEIAALVAVLTAASGGGAARDVPTGGVRDRDLAQWAPPTRLLRPTVAPTGWWESALPR